LRRTVRQLEEGRSREVHLNLELQHRVKNTLAVVQGLATQTFRDVPDVASSLVKLQGRIRALADANDILRDGHWEACRLPELAVRALEPFNDAGGMSLCGPECSLPEDSCVPLHELATNAVKYGALSKRDGTVELCWEFAGDEPDELTIRWRERGGPTVVPPTRRGLGSKLLRPQPGLDRVLVDFLTDGVACLLKVRGARPLTRTERTVSITPSPTLYSTGAPRPV